MKYILLLLKQELTCYLDHVGQAAKNCWWDYLEYDKKSWGKYTDENGYNVLHFAVQSGSVDFCRKLIDDWPDLAYAKNDANFDPLTLAESSLTREEISVLRRHVETKLNPKIASDRADIAQIISRVNENNEEIKELRNILKSQCALLEKLENSPTFAQH